METTISDSILLCSILMSMAMFVAYLTKKHRFIYLPESASAMLLGIVFGALIKCFSSGENLEFDHQAFFYGLLPIIIFNAGYSLKRKDFFENFVAISLFALVGTVISALVYGLGTYLLYAGGLITHLNSESPLLECLMFGSLISATDPVATLSVLQDLSTPTMLYNLVLGESLVNDASAIVLFRTFESFLNKEFNMATIGVAIIQFGAISIGSITLGFAVSLLCAVVLKYIDIQSEYTKFELAFFLLSAYLAYTLSEFLSLSGIMSLFFCGVCNAHYSYYNASKTSKISSRYAFEALSYLAEIFVFAYLGLQVVLFHHVLDFGLLVSAIPLCLLSRAANIFPLSWLANEERNLPITNRMQVAMWSCGLRGAVAYALSVNLPSSKGALQTATLFIVVSTTLLFGIATGPMLRALNLTSTTIPAVGLKSADLPTHELRDRPETGSYTERPYGRIFSWLDQTYMRPIFGGQNGHDDLDDDLEDSYSSMEQRDETLEGMKLQIAIGKEFPKPSDVM